MPGEVAVSSGENAPSGQAVPAAPAPSDSGGSSGIDWGKTLSSFEADDGDAPAAPQAPQASTPQGETAAAPSTPASPSATPAPASAPASVPAAPTPAVAPAPATAPTAPPAVTIEQAVPAAAGPVGPVGPTAEQRLEMRNQLVNDIARSYQISEVDATKLMTAPNEILPQMAARIVVDAMDRIVPVVMNGVFSALPQFVDQHMGARTVATKNEDAFFQKWPELKEHEAKIAPLAKAFRDANPKATMEQAIVQVGMMVWNAAGLPMDKLLLKLADPPKGAPTGAPVVAVHAPTGYAPAIAPNASAAALNVKAWTDKTLEEFLAADADT